MKKIASVLLILAILMLSLVACTVKTENESGTDSESETENEKISETVSSETEEIEKKKYDINLTVLAGPTGMGAAKLINDNANGSSTNNYTVTVATAPDVVTASIINGECDIAALPTNLAAVLYNKTKGGIKILALNTAGVLYILENGNSISSVADLKGKTIYSSGQSAVPEYALDYILAQNGIDPDTDVNIIYLSSHAELATMMSSGNAEICILPEPNVTAVLSANENVRIALDLTEEWEKVNDSSSLIMGCVVARTEFIENNPEAVESFLKEYSASINFALENTDEASEMIAEAGIVGKAAVAKKALPNCSLIYIDGEKMATALDGFFEVLYDANPSSVGGAIPGNEIYYK